MIGAVAQTVLWSVVFYFASPAASAAYLTVSEIFPLEIRALAISIFYSLGIPPPISSGLSFPAQRVRCQVRASAAWWRQAFLGTCYRPDKRKTSSTATLRRPHSCLSLQWSKRPLGLTQSKSLWKASLCLFLYSRPTLPPPPNQPPQPLP